jgi:DNA-binding transcriptional regulator GbsR (MarR family)
MNQRDMKVKRIEHLLDLMKREPMSSQQMADAVNMSHKAFSKYLTEMRYKKLVHIARYSEATSGARAVYYMTGNFPDVVRPLPCTQQEYKKRYKAKLAGLSNKKTKFIPRPDYAAAWLFHPITK